MKILAALLVAAGVALAQDPPAETTLQKIEREVSAVVEKARRSVVMIRAVHRVPVQQGVWVTETMKLSGIAWTADGLILTDAGGVQSATDLSALLPDGRELPAVLVAFDRRTNIAVLRVKADNLVPAEPADPADLRQGTYAIAIGNPQGLKGSASVGFVSGLGRSVLVAGRRYDDLVQMTTVVQPGDAGGFVANSKGQLVGMVHSSHQSGPLDPATLGVLRLFGKDATDFAPVGTPVTSFATPVSMLKFVAERIRKNGRMDWGWVGLTVWPLEEDLRLLHKIPEGQGARINAVDKAGPARRAGLRRNDILVSFDGAPVTDLRALRKKVAEVESPAVFRVAVLRDGERVELDLPVETGPQP